MGISTDISIIIVDASSSKGSCVKATRSASMETSRRTNERTSATFRALQAADLYGRMTAISIAIMVIRTAAKMMKKLERVTAMLTKSPILTSR